MKSEGAICWEAGYFSASKIISSMAMRPGIATSPRITNIQRKEEPTDSQKSRAGALMPCACGYSPCFWTSCDGGTWISLSSVPVGVVFSFLPSLNTHSLYSRTCQLTARNMSLAINILQLLHKTVHLLKIETQK